MSGKSHDHDEVSCRMLSSQSHRLACYGTTHPNLVQENWTEIAQSLVECQGVGLQVSSFAFYRLFYFYFYFSSSSPVSLPFLPFLSIRNPFSNTVVDLSYLDSSLTADVSIHQVELGLHRCIHRC